jgi:hypothetical protein
MPIFAALYNEYLNNNKKPISKNNEKTSNDDVSGVIARDDDGTANPTEVGAGCCCRFA